MDAIGYKMGLIPEDRKQHGALLNMDVKFNISYASLDKIASFGFLNKKKEKNLATDYIAALAIKTPGELQAVKNLSGGNQQKVVLAKWLATQCDILIFDEPTRGIDVGAKQEICTLMRNLVAKNKSIIMISSEMPELIGMSDRVLVMKEGTLPGEVAGAEMTQERILTIDVAGSGEKRTIDGVRDAGHRNCGSGIRRRKHRQGRPLERRRDRPYDSVPRRQAVQLRTAGLLRAIRLGNRAL